MSVAAQLRYHAGAKRLFEHQDSAEQGYTSPGSGSRRAEPRKARRLGSGATGRDLPSSQQAAYAVGPSTLIALRGLFPDMDDKVG